MTASAERVAPMQDRAPWRALFVAALAIAYLIILVNLYSWWCKEAALVPQVARAEANLRLAASGPGGEQQALQAELAASQARLARLQAQIPSSLDPNLFADVALAAQQSGIQDFKYQQKGRFTETMQAGTYVVYRFNVSGRGSQQQILDFLDTLQQQIGPTMVIENVVISSVAPDWTLSADILVYTLGG